jgi:hypothetical protein
MCGLLTQRELYRCRSVQIGPGIRILRVTLPSRFRVGLHLGDARRVAHWRLQRLAALWAATERVGTYVKSAPRAEHVSLLQPLKHAELELGHEHGEHSTGVWELHIERCLLYIEATDIRRENSTYLD